MTKTICGALVIAGLVFLSVNSLQAAAGVPYAGISSGSSQDPVPSDDTLKDRIAYRLDTNPMVRKYDVKVKVDQGIATLSGSVATRAQKEEAERIARIDGVKRVESNIEINKDADKTAADRIKGGFSKTGEKISDAWITTKVNWFFVGEDLLKGSDINVDTKDNVVTLKGTVKSQAGRARAVELAQNTDGVKRVIDQLIVARTSAQ